MKDYATADLRTFAVVGHASSGKTMLCEAMVVCGGVINRLGSIAAGTTVSDYHDSERERQISINSSLMHIEWLGKKLNIIDTPGYLDFTSESLAALRVADFALVVAHAIHGVLVGTDQVWDFASRFGIPKMLVVNAVDKENADFDKVLEQARKRYGDRVFPMGVPLNPGPGFNQILDVMRSEVVTYQTDGSGKFSEVPATGKSEAKVKELHQQLIELIAESDDSLLEKFFAQGGLSEEDLRAGLHKAVQKQAVIPMFCTAAESNVGVARLLDFMAKYGAEPNDRPKTAGLDSNDAETELAISSPETTLYIFKTISEAQFGELSHFRVYSGTVHASHELYNSKHKSSEKIGQLYILNGKNRTNVAALHAGDIGAVVKLKHTHSGDTLCEPKRIIALPRLEYPQPNIHAALKLNSKGEEDKIAQGLAALHAEDPTFLFHVDSELHQTVISAQGELHLQVVLDRLKKRYKVDVELVPPKIPFRETIKIKAESKYRHKKQTGGAGQFAEVWMRIEPKPRNTGVEFVQTLSGQNVDRSFVPSVEKGVQTACTEGIVAGYRVVDTKIDFYDGKMHPVDSKDIAFQIAGYFAFKEAFAAAKPCLLEPINEIEIKIPDDCMGKVMGDLSGRRGKILGMDSIGEYQIVKAQVPAVELYHYSTSLRSLTGGRGLHTEKFSHYEEMAREQEQRVIAESKKAKEAKEGH